MRGIITRLMQLGYLSILRLVNEAKSTATECRIYIDFVLYNYFAGIITNI